MTPAVAIVLTILGLFMGVAALCYFAKKDLKNLFALVDKTRRQRKQPQPDTEAEHSAAATTSS